MNIYKKGNVILKLEITDCPLLKKWTKLDKQTFSKYLNVTTIKQCKYGVSFFLYQKEIY